jgi:hypothetical protein
MNMDVERIASSEAACQRLQRIPGIGPLIVTAIVAAIGNGAAFRKGREFAAWMGLVLIHGARAGVIRLKRERVLMGSLMTALEARAAPNVLIVATSCMGSSDATNAQKEKDRPASTVILRPSPASQFVKLSNWCCSQWIDPISPAP